jgi:hypothetical protein
METDGEAQMMYFLFRYHHMRPREFRDMLPGERRVTYALMRYEIGRRIIENTPPGD